MRLGVNCWRLRTRTGVSRVIANVLRYWTPELVDGRIEDITVYSPVELDDDLDIPSWITRRITRPDLPMLAWENTVLPLVCKDDVLLCPSYTRPLLTSSKTVSLIYEATQKLFPEHYPLRTRFINTPLHGFSARHSTRVITNTEQARSDIEAAYGASASRMRVVPLAPAEVFRPDYSVERLAEVRLRYAGADVPYFLYVGKLTARRNVPNIIEALAMMRADGLHPHRLVIVGLNTTQLDIPGISEALGLGNEVRYFPFVADEDLAPLYSAAEAFVLPYSYESAASLTLLEAQAAGIPVITAGTVGLRQASGGGALFVEDVDSSRLSSAMRVLVTNADLRVELIEKGKSNVAAYSWARCSSDVLDICLEAGSA